MAKIVHYSLRPAKNIERKMIAEALLRLSGVSSFTKCQYVGFGSEFFNDFSLFHQTLGIRDMISIEKDMARLKRCAFNRPFKCVRVLGGQSSHVLPTLAWKKRTVAWLDYTGQLNKSILDDTALVCSQACSGSVLIWTVNAHPASPQGVPADELPAIRLASLQENVGRLRVRAELKGAELSGWGLATESYHILIAEIHRQLTTRNATSLPPDQLKFRQFLHFHYEDGAKMLTVGGVLLNPADAVRLGKNAFIGLPYIQEGAVPTLLKPPILTGREIRHLNRCLPGSAAKIRGMGWLSAEERKNYKCIYRYYPVFSEAEL